MTRLSFVACGLALLIWTEAGIAQPSISSATTSAASPHSVVAAVPGVTDVASAPVFFVLPNTATVYRYPDHDWPYVELAFHEPVHVLEQTGAWAKVTTMDGAVGYMHRSELSNVWIRVRKSKKTVYVYEGERLLRSLPADLAYNFFSDKQRRGSAERPDHWRTPEGKFYVTAKNPSSQFYKAFVLNYPTAEDAERGLADGIISRPEYNQIVAAAESRLQPPMNTALGGLIEIHGSGTGARVSWTKGCIAVPNEGIDDIWASVRVGTPVLIEP